jgi:glycine hydroxymethyltransferase
MPLWYTSISAEHDAVRQNAGIFDCTHMGILEIAGTDAEGFLNEVTTNDVCRLQTGAAQYGYILDAAGNVLDDIIIYKRWSDKFMVVVNAANEAKIRAYFDGILAGEVVVDIADRGRRIAYRPDIRDMRDVSEGGDCRCDIAIQGPASSRVVAGLADSAVKQAIEGLRSFRFVEGAVAGIDCIVARTGYTGARTGYELFVHAGRAGELWDALLESGAKAGLVPCGLGARDSLRIEAGLPLYGHELDGEWAITPFEAGYGWAVKSSKGFFIGRGAIVQKEAAYRRRVVRLELPGQNGIRPVRMHDGVLDGDGRCVGEVLSCAKAGCRQVALAIIEAAGISEGSRVGIYYAARNPAQAASGRHQRMQVGDEYEADMAGKVLSRFEKF